MTSSYVYLLLMLITLLGLCYYLSLMIYQTHLFRVLKGIIFMHVTFLEKHVLKNSSVPVLLNGPHRIGSYVHICYYEVKQTVLSEMP